MIQDVHHEPIALLFEGKLVTLLRPDLPEGWQPPEGHTICLQSEVPKDAVPVAEPDTRPLITRLSEAFKAYVPEQYWGQFGVVFGAVGTLLDKGEVELARATVADTPVPPELEEAKAGLLALMDSSS